MNDVGWMMDEWMIYDDGRADGQMMDGQRHGGRIDGWMDG